MCLSCAWHSQICCFGSACIAWALSRQHIKWRWLLVPLVRLGKAAALAAARVTVRLRTTVIASLTILAQSGYCASPRVLLIGKVRWNPSALNGDTKVLHALCEFCAHNELLNIEHVRRAGHPSGWLCGDAVGPAVLHWVEQLQAAPARSSSARSRSPPVSRCGFDVC